MGLPLQFMPLYRRLLGYVRPYRARLAGGIFFSIIFGATSGVLLFVLQKIWARAFEEGGVTLGWMQMLSLALLLPCVMFARGVCDFMGTYLMNWVGLRVVMDLRIKLFEHLQDLSLEFFGDSQTGELISRVTNDVAVIQQAISNVIEDIVKQPCTLLCVLGYLLYLDWKLTLASLIIFPLCVAPIMIFGRRTRKASRAGQEFQAEMVSVLHEALTGLRVIKAFGMEKAETRDFSELCRQVFRRRMQVIRAKATTSPTIEVVAGVGAAIVFMYAYQAKMQASHMITMCVGLFMLYDPVKKLSRVHLQIQESLTGAERIFEILDRKITVVEAPLAPVLPRFGRSIRFEDVSFHYNGARQGGMDAVLDQVRLEIPVGSLTALVGASGAGKTTVFSLLMRFYDPTGGSIKLDDQDIRDVSFKSLREQFGLVTQDTFLFNATVANNIGYGKPGATREEIIAAAQSAHAHEFIMQMPQQYDTPVGDLGVKLSGGQRQRLAIARAILRNPPILLLDEATSALDTESERVVQTALDELMSETAERQTTMLVIAHRLSTVQHADRIIVLDRGRVVEQGTHRELIERGKVYKKLHDLQFKV